MRIARTVLGVVVCLGTTLAAHADERHRLPYEDLAKSAIQRAGIEDPDPQTFNFELFLDSGFLHARLGLYDLYLPAGESLRTSELEDYRDLALALLDAQRGWLDWMAPAGKGTREPLSDLKRVRNWVKAWKVDRLRQSAGTGQLEALEALKAKGAVRDASNRLSQFMGLGSTLPLDRQVPVFEPVVLVPDRERFVEMICIGGWLYPQHRATFWNHSIRDWTHFYLDRYQFLSLELTDPTRGAHDWITGVSMNYRNPRAMSEQVSQLGIGSLLDNYYESRIPPSLAGALSVNLVIDLFGECDTRADGDLRLRRTQAREIFVPGGASEGGVLPPLSADSRWRDRLGAEHFVSLLRQAQKKGAAKVRKSKDKHRHFELLNDSGNRRRVVSGPFLGARAMGADELPEEYRGDWVEFLRSYRSCFLWWLQSKAERSKKNSGKSFAALLHGLASDTDREDVTATFPEIYDGLALSSDELAKKDLEGRFLLWLAKQ